MAEIICGVYKITNTITNDFYIGSSKDVKRRWTQHKCPSYLKKHPNNQLYKDIQKYGKDKFSFQILEEVKPAKLKEVEQQFIELLKPTYNSNRANGWDIKKRKEYWKEYNQQNREKYKEYQKEYYQQNREKQKEYQKEYYQHNSEKQKEYQKEYYQHNSEKRKEYQKEYNKSEKYKEYQNKYNNQTCSYNGETLTLNALRQRFKKYGIEHPAQEAKKYLVL